MDGTILPEVLLRYRNPDGGMPYSPGMQSFSEPTLLMILGLVAAGASAEALPLIEWILKTRNADGSIGLNPEFRNEGIWNSSLLAIAMHQLGRHTERDSAIDFLLRFRSIKLSRTPDNDLDTALVGWPWVAHTFGWVEPTAWALLSLELAGKSDHPRAVEGRRLLADRCLPEGGWNYGNKIVFNHTLMPFWDSTAIATLSLGDHNPELVNKNLDLLEKSSPGMHSLLTNALTCLCLNRYGRKTESIRLRIAKIIGDLRKEEWNLAHSAMSLIALSDRRVLTP